MDFVMLLDMMSIGFWLSLFVTFLGFGMNNWRISAFAALILMLVSIAGMVFTHHLGVFFTLKSWMFWVGGVAGAYISFSLLTLNINRKR